MYTDKTALGTEVRPDGSRKAVKVINKPAHVEVQQEAAQDEAEANMCPGSRDI